MAGAVEITSNSATNTGQWSVEVRSMVVRPRGSVLAAPPTSSRRFVSSPFSGRFPQVTPVAGVFLDSPWIQWEQWEQKSPSYGIPDLDEVCVERQRSRQGQPRRTRWTRARWMPCDDPEFGASEVAFCQSSHSGHTRSHGILQWNQLRRICGLQPAVGARRLKEPGPCAN